MKKRLRQDILKKRNALSDSEITDKSRTIMKKLFSLPEFKKSKTVMFFVSFGKEVNTHDMIKTALKNKTVCVPVVCDDDLEISKINSYDDLSKQNKYCILEPEKIKEINIDDIDIIIVPGLAFDLAGYRVGYGKGYYDKLLNNFEKEKIGLAFDLQIVKELPKEDHDVVIDRIITEKRVIKCDQLVKWDV